MVYHNLRQDISYEGHCLKNLANTWHKPINMCKNLYVGEMDLAKLLIEQGNKTMEVTKTEMHLHNEVNNQFQPFYNFSYKTRNKQLFSVFFVYLLQKISFSNFSLNTSVFQLLPNRITHKWFIENDGSFLFYKMWIQPSVLTLQIRNWLYEK